MNDSINICVKSNGKWQIKTITVCLVIVFLFMLVTYQTVSVKVGSQFNVYYSLNAGHNDQQLIKVIDNADKYIYFAIYYFSKNSIADALIRAKNRGIDVIGIMDRDASIDTNHLSNQKRTGETPVPLHARILSRPFWLEPFAMNSV